MNEQPPDDFARNAIRDQIYESLFVEAGAGTGKTRELVARIVELIARGLARIDQIVAITFTEAAAAEMKERIRSALERERAIAPTERASRCDLALPLLEAAPIQTIHAFARRILQQFPTEAGLPPVFEVRESVDSRLAFNQRWLMFARELFDAPPVEEVDDVRASTSTFAPLSSVADRLNLIRTACALGMTPNHFRLIAAAMESQWHRLRKPVGTSSPPPNLDIRPLLTAVDRALSHLPHCLSNDDRLACKLRDEVEPWRRRLARTSNDAYSAMSALTNSPTLPANIGAKPNWPKGLIETARADLERVNELKTELLDAPRQWVLSEVSRLLGTFILDGEDYRRQSGKLDFHDLLVLARDLARNPHIRKGLQEQYRYILVDEFQDTDPLQVELINLLTASDGTQHPGGRLFVVGDPKQSIYRFRNADLQQYFKLRETQIDNLVQLHSNFRTLPLIVQWVNETFEKLLSGRLGETWNDLSWARNGTGSVALFGSELDNARSSEVREIETKDMAVRLSTIVSERWAVHDNDGTARPARFHDIAVLLPTRRSLAAVERSLRQLEIPYRVESRSLVWATQEVRDLIGVLRCIDDPQNEIALVATLRSTAFACSDIDLLTWRQAGGTWRLDDDPPETLTSHPVAKARLILRDLRHRQVWATVPQIVDDILTERRMFQAAFAKRRQRESWNRYRFLHDQAEAWLEGGGSTLHGFLQWAGERRELESASVEVVVPESDDDAVRIMTIHAAKGLEFPVVFVAGLGSRSSVSESARVLWGGDDQMELRVGPKTGGWQTRGFPAAESNDLAEEEAEQLRLLYVAATRARDHILIGIYRSSGKRGSESLAGRLAAASSTASAGQIIHAHLQSSDAEIPTRPDVRSPIETEQEEEDVQMLLERRMAAIGLASRPTFMSATAIAAASAGEQTPLRGSLSANRQREPGSSHIQIPESPGAGPALERHATAFDDLSVRLALGSAVHAALEALPFDASELSVSEAAKTATSDRDIPQLALAAERSITLALGSDLIEAARKSRNWREVPASALLDDIVIGGSIDLMYEEQGGLVIVDYKTEPVPDETARKAALERYRLQLLTYCLAVQKSLQRPVIAAHLLFIPPDASEAIQVSISTEALLHAEDALRQGLRAAYC